MRFWTIKTTSFIVFLVAISYWYMGLRSPLSTLLRTSFLELRARPVTPSLTSSARLPSTSSSVYSPATTRTATTTTSITMGRTKEPTVASTAKTDDQLTEREKKEWNHLADMMTRYHDHFKHSYHAIYQVSTSLTYLLGILFCLHVLLGLWSGIFFHGKLMLIDNNVC